MSEKNILVLFDIDGTLIHPGAGARLSMLQALRENIDSKLKLEPRDFAGKTDMTIVTDLLMKSGCLISELNDLLRQVLSRYIELMKIHFNAENDAYMYAGVRALLDELLSVPAVHFGLLTGNIEEGARIKLAPFDLNTIFPVGAFGNDGFTRSELPPVAVNRAEAYYGIRFGAGDIVVIGDTVEDVKCGKIIGARTIGISQHLNNSDELKTANADVIFDSFEKTDDIVASVLGHT